MKSTLLRMASLVLCLAAVHPACAQPAASSQQAQPPQLTAEQWRADLRFMVAEMKRRHPNLYHSAPRERFDREVAMLDARIPKLHRSEIIVGMMRIAALVGDGHTRVDPRKDAKFAFPSLPLKLYLFEDGLFVRAARPDFAGLVGAEVTAIGGVPVSEGIRRTHEISSVDNVIGYRLFAPLYLSMPDILHALKLSKSPGSAVLTLRKNGKTWTTTVPAGQVDPLWPPDTDVSLQTPDGWVDGRTAPQPLWLGAPLDYHRLIPLADAGALYAQVNMITDVEGQSLAAFAEKIRREAEKANVRAIILDFRLSYGGNHDLRHRFIREMVKAEDADTRLYVLTWRGAFSATEAFLVDLRRLTDAVFIGEPASSKPNSFGDAYRMAMPNSGISIRTSIQFNQLAGQSKQAWTPVDIAAPYKFADYAAGRDPALAMALNAASKPDLSKAVMAVRSAAALRAAVDAFMTSPRNRYADLEEQAINAAAALSAAKRPEDALMVMQIAARRFPNSHDVQSILAAHAEEAAQLDVAIEAGRKALLIDPNSRFARSLVERVEKAQRPSEKVE